MAATSATGGYLLPKEADPVSDLDLDVTFQRVVRGITGLPGEMVRPRVQPNDGMGQALPQIPNQHQDWCAIGVTEERADGGVAGIQIHDSSGDGSTTLRRFIVIAVLASFYGLNSGRYAARLRDGLCIGQNREALFHANLALVSVGAIRAVPDVPNGIPRRRQDIEMRFRLRADRAYAILNLLEAQGEIRTEADAHPFKTET